MSNVQQNINLKINSYGTTFFQPIVLTYHSLFGTFITIYALDSGQCLFSANFEQNRFSFFEWTFEKIQNKRQR